MEVQLRAARIPFVGRIAHHHWFVVIADGGEPTRWEIWQWRNAGGEAAWGHLHRNLLAFDQGVGNGPSWIVRTWRGEDAAALARRLDEAPETYPWRCRYLPWPGPNSNTFVRWILEDASGLGWQALGKRYPVWRRFPRGLTACGSSRSNRR
ncbi:MAG: DUF3750 domain-containing protein [Pseudomonadota bacterium]